MERHPLHIKIPDLQKSPEVSDAVDKHERQEEEILPNDPNIRIGVYMSRLENVFLNPKKMESGESVGARNLEILRPFIYDAFIIKPENIPEQVFLLEQKIAREMGHGTLEITDEFKQKKTEQIISDQKHSLDQWINYLTSEDSTYPTWSKYFVFTSVSKMGGLKKNIDETGKENAVFKKRTKETVASFPPLNARALAMTISVITEQLKRDGSEVKNTSTKLTDEEFAKLVQSENFSKIYAQFLIELPEYGIEGLEEIRGKWVKYSHGSDPTPLVKSLDGYPLEWCTANPDTAKSHLQGGDFYVFYSLDQDGNPVIPRLAIRMDGENIGEDPRGIAPNQNLDPYIAPVLEEKLKEFGEKGKQYKKKSADMKKLTVLDQKNENGESLTKSDLEFLYEINSSIDGFGYAKDPRVEEIRKARNKAEDMQTIFECSKDQIAEKPEDINENTTAYLGEWNINIYQSIKQYPKIKYLYESFPDKKIFMQTIDTDPVINSPEKAESALKEKGIWISDLGKDILYKTEFSQTKEKYELVRFSVEQLGFPQGATTDQIYSKAKELGLELCPAEVGPNLRLSYSGGEYMFIAMEQIIDHGGDPSVFYLDWSGDELGLNVLIAEPGLGWRSDYKLVFLSRKS